MDRLEKLNMAAMRIIMDAGDARDYITKALKAMSQNDYTAVGENIRCAQEKIKSAHGIQTEIVQEEIEGEPFPPSLLFNHAQDTLMTISTELNLAREFQIMMKNVHDRLTKLEETK